MATPPFTLEPGNWYAMTMYPGYTNEIYRSPVEVQAIRPLGQRRFELTFYNVGYAEGVQMIGTTFRTLYRHESALITQEELVKYRTTIFEPLTAAWVSAFTPGFGAMMLDALRRRQTMGFYQAERSAAQSA